MEINPGKMENHKSFRNYVALYTIFHNYGIRKSVLLLIYSVILRNSGKHILRNSGKPSVITEKPNYLHNFP